MGLIDNAASAAAVAVAAAAPLQQQETQMLPLEVEPTEPAKFSWATLASRNTGEFFLFLCFFDCSDKNGCLTLLSLSEVLEVQECKMKMFIVFAVLMFPLYVPINRVFYLFFSAWFSVCLTVKLRRFNLTIF